jgi:hypothetical protein
MCQNYHNENWHEYCIHCVNNLTNMVQVLLTYDISQRHSEVKAALKDKGFHDSWTVEKIKYNLPNTTMWKKGDSVTALSVKSDMEMVIADLNRYASFDKTIKIERCISVVFSSWAGITGEPHKS